jgi:hypothetical protein
MLFSHYANCFLITSLLTVLITKPLANAETYMTWYVKILTNDTIDPNVSLVNILTYRVRSFSKCNNFDLICHYFLQCPIILRKATVILAIGHCCFNQIGENIYVQYNLSS